jgi:type VI secretion system protein VasD
LRVVRLRRLDAPSRDGPVSSVPTGRAHCVFEVDGVGHSLSQLAQINQKERRMPSASRIFRVLALVLPVLVAFGCASPPPPPPKPTIVQITIDVDPGVNPDSRGRASPVVAKLFELKSLAAFESADFFSLAEKDKDTLGTELVAREEFQLQPKESRKFERKLPPESRYIGVVAAFRDLERATWRAAVAIPPEKVTNLTIRFDARSVSINAR